MIEIFSSGLITKDNQICSFINGFGYETLSNEESLKKLKTLFFLEDDEQEILFSAENLLKDSDFLEKLSEEYRRRSEVFLMAPATEFSISEENLLCWNKCPIAALKKGDDLLSPQYSFLHLENIPADLQKNILEKTSAVFEEQINLLLKPFKNLQNADFLLDDAAKIKNIFLEKMTFIPRYEIFQEVKRLDQTARSALRQLGVRFGALHVYLPLMLRPQNAQFFAYLWSLYHSLETRKESASILAFLKNGRASIQVDSSLNVDFYKICGYALFGKYAVRVDMLERLIDLVREKTNWHEEMPYVEGAFSDKKFYITPSMLSILGMKREDVEEILVLLNYKREPISIKDFEKEIKKYLSFNFNFNFPKAEPVGDHAKQYQLLEKEKISLASLISFLKEKQDQISLWRYEPKKNKKTLPKNKNEPLKLKVKKFERPKKKKNFVKVGKTREIKINPSTFDEKTSPFSALASLRQELLKSK